MFVDLRHRQGVEQRHELVAQHLTPRHPLVIGTAAVLIGTVQLRGGKQAQHRLEDSHAPSVHPECDMGLLSVSAEMALTDQDSEQKPLVEIGQRGGWVDSRHVSPSSFP